MDLHVMMWNYKIAAWFINTKVNTKINTQINTHADHILHGSSINRNNFIVAKLIITGWICLISVKIPPLHRHRAQRNCQMLQLVLLYDVLQDHLFHLNTVDRSMVLKNLKGRECTDLNISCVLYKWLSNSNIV